MRAHGPTRGGLAHLERWHRADLETLRHILGVVDINLGKAASLLRELLRELGVDWRCRLARWAPQRVRVDHHDLARAARFEQAIPLLEIVDLGDVASIVGPRLRALPFIVEEEEERHQEERPLLEEGHDLHDGVHMGPRMARRWRGRRLS